MRARRRVFLCTLQPGRRPVFSVHTATDSDVSLLQKVILLKQEAIINGQRHRAIRSRNTPVSVYYRGQYFETEEELWMAKLLRKMKIVFLHHVSLELTLPDQPHPRLWRPDFIFERPVRWVDDHAEGAIIFGIEVKKTKMGGKPQTLSDAAFSQYGIRILVINRKILKPWFEAGLLPVEDISLHGSSVH